METEWSGGWYQAGAGSVGGNTENHSEVCNIIHIVVVLVDWPVSVAAQTPSLLYLDPEDQLQGRQEVDRFPAGEAEGDAETLGGDQGHHQHWGTAGTNCLPIKCSNIGQSHNRSVTR